LRHGAALDDLRDALLARLTPKGALLTEIDLEAVLLTMGSVTCGLSVTARLAPPAA
jgi:hypothetical protein